MKLFALSFAPSPLPLSQSERGNNHSVFEAQAFRRMLSAHEPTNFGRPGRRDHRRRSHQTSTASLGMVASGGDCALYRRRLTRIVDLHFSSLVWLARLLRGLLVHVQVEARAVCDLLRAHSPDPARKFLVNRAHLRIDRLRPAHDHGQPTTGELLTLARAEA